MKSVSTLVALYSFIWCIPLAADEINIYTWEEYFAPEVIEQFESETGHQVNFVYFDSEPTRDKVVTSGRASIYDLIIIDNYAQNLFGSRGLLATLDSKQLNNFKHIDPLAIQACGQHGLPYAQGTMGIGYRTSKVSSPPSSWMDVFRHVEHSPGSVVIPIQEIDTVAIALMALGFDPMTSDEVKLKKAYQLLNGVKEQVLAFRNADSYAQDIQSDSEMELAVIYSGETESISEATSHDDWVYTVPDEGSIIWYECLSGVADKPFSAATIEFLDFLNRPAIAAFNASEVWFTTTNLEALKYTDQEYLSDTELFPGTEAITNSYQYQMLEGAGYKLRNRIILSLPSAGRVLK